VGDPLTSRIFINYRRDDSRDAAARLYDHLTQHFGRDYLFMDIDAIEPGADFVKTLNENLSDCAVMISVIGPGWSSRRLDDPNDFVRQSTSLR
jgi:TIR domain